MQSKRAKKKQATVFKQEKEGNRKLWRDLSHPLKQN